MLKSNMLLPAVMQVTGNICETLNFSRVWEQFYWTARKLKRKENWPQHKGIMAATFIIKAQLVEKKKRIRSPVNFVGEEIRSYLSSQQDGHCKLYQGRECDKTYENKSTQTVKSIRTKILTSAIRVKENCQCPSTTDHMELAKVILETQAEKRPLGQKHKEEKKHENRRIVHFPDYF